MFDFLKKMFASYNKQVEVKPEDLLHACVPAIQTLPHQRPATNGRDFGFCSCNRCSAVAHETPEEHKDRIISAISKELSGMTNVTQIQGAVFC